MKTIPTFIRLNGWNYRLLKRVGNLALYSQGMTAAFEVLRIRTRKPRLFRGILWPAREELPSAEEFGKRAWTFPTLEGAEAKFAALILADEENAKNAPTPTERAAILSDAA